jgi:type IV pilus assembly protein PilQ
VPQPKIFTTGNPPRIAVDFADTDNTAARHLNIGQGSTLGVSAVTAGGRTRVVVELMRESTYRSRIEGHSLLLTINNGTADQSVTTVATIDPSKVLPSSMNGPSISNIDFRRGPNGEGRVLISFSGAGANAQMTHKGDMVTVNIDHANLPANLAQRLDTLDFATPVQSIVTKSGMGGGAHIEIAVKGNVDTSGYQTPDQYVVEVTSKKADATADKLTKDGQSLPVYSGKRATFNFQDIPVRSALQLIADESGLNLVASDSVTGGVTLRLDNVPWDQALDVILRAKGLDKRRDGNVVWIAPQAELAKYEQDIADAKLKAQDTAELITDYVPISYGKASDIAKLLTTGSLQAAGGGVSTSNNAQHGFLSTRGSVAFDVRTNTLLLNDTPEKIKQLRELIAVLDKPVQQVLIESRLVVATDNFTRDLGAKFGISGKKTNSGNVISTGGQDNGTGTASGLNFNLPSTTTGGSFGLAILGANYSLDLELSAAQTEGKTEVISSPRVITANQQEAVIRQGQEIGYVTVTGVGANATSSVNFKDAVLELKVTPTITADNRIYLLINVTKDALQGYVNSTSGSVPTINTSSVNTSALVDNGQTVVLGGIYELNNSDSVVKVPGLGDVPILGALFRQSTRSKTKAELLIFVTPRILSETLQ